MQLSFYPDLELPPAWVRSNLLSKSVINCLVFGSWSVSCYVCLQWRLLPLTFVSPHNLGVCLYLFHVLSDFLMALSPQIPAFTLKSATLFPIQIMANTTKIRLVLYKSYSLSYHLNSLNYLNIVRQSLVVLDHLVIHCSTADGFLPVAFGSEGSVALCHACCITQLPDPAVAFDLTNGLTE